MQKVRRQLSERMRDIRSYLEILKFMEQARGTISIQGRTAKTLTVAPNTIHVLKAGVFLHLYNLVESTVTTGLQRIAEQIKSQELVFVDLDDCWRRAWIRSFAKFEDTLDAERALQLCQAVSEGTVVPIRPKVAIGNLDDRRIEDIARRFGIQLAFRPDVAQTVKRQVLDDLGFLGLVRKKRNILAHGDASFSDVGRDYSADDLRRWSRATHEYLKDVIASFDRYLKAQQFRR